MRYEVKRTGWVDWNFNTSSSSGYELILWPVLMVLNVLVWLPHRARGRGYTLHIYNESNPRRTKQLFATRGQAEAALAERRGSAIDPRGEGSERLRRRRAHIAADGAAGPAPSRGDMDGPFHRGRASHRS